ncbi:DNA cytosine methyltransferase [Paenibacillus sp. RC84]|uniref:DNA cytosine methyltransferase n=1 Tax=Paenibacillus sp. RC84 TaxID=3156252 RepID=UPI003515B87E
MRHAIDLFSGAGGVSEAARGLFDIICAVEYDEVIASTYGLNHGKGHLLVKDIKKIKKKQWVNIKKTRLGNRPLDLLIATPPCQGFSRHSRKKSSNNRDERNKLTLEILRVTNLFEPTFIFFENVDNVLNYKVFHIFLELLANVDTLGYKKHSNRPSYHLRFEIVDAADYGVPQRRKRLILIGKKIEVFPNGDATILYSSKGTPYISSPLPIWPAKNKAPKLGEYLREFNLPPLNAGQTDANDILHKCRNLSDVNLQRIRNTPRNGGSRSDWPPDLSLGLACHSKENVSFGDVYGRMNYEDYSPTITCGCLAYTKGRFGHPVEDRAISMREAALIQSFPVSYKFTGRLNGKVNEGSSENIATQIGNAVPVKLARCFLEEFHKQLNLSEIEELPAEEPLVEV